MLTTERESMLILQIALRAEEAGKKYGVCFGGAALVSCQLAIVHFSIMKLNLEEMLNGSDTSLLYDLVGIDAHLQMYDKPHLIAGWRPRFAKEKIAPSGNLFAWLGAAAIAAAAL